jgi:hypothetical protein
MHCLNLTITLPLVNSSSSSSYVESSVSIPLASFLTHKAQRINSFYRWLKIEYHVKIINLIKKLLLNGKK